jgi:ribosomal-protein-alanine N-acetyltransferase
MSALPVPASLQVRPMRIADVDAVMAIEARAYGFPWSRGNMVDSLSAGHLAEVLVGEAGEILGYCIAMSGVDEMHLLNITVAPEWQRHGLGSRLLDALVAHCRELHLGTLWLEVRASNVGAHALYLRRGFTEVARRRGYYPAPRGTREDAIVMSLVLSGGEAGDALE